MRPSTLTSKRLRLRGEQLEHRHCLSAVTFVEHEIPGQLINAAELSDADGDNDLDIMSNRRWLENADSKGGFDKQHKIPRGSVQSVSDLDADGDQDLLVTLSSRDSWRISWYPNTNGFGEFGDENTIATQEHHAPTYIGAFDIDLDGDLDVVSNWTYAGLLPGGTVEWYENTNGLGRFFGPGNPIAQASNVLGVPGGRIYDLQVVDVDQDDDFDVVLTKSGLGIFWIENTNLGTFGAEHLITSGHLDDDRSDTVVTDLDGDGDMDVVSAGETIRWFANTDGQGNFAEPRMIAPSDEGTYSIKPADLDLDGDVDLIRVSFSNCNGCIREIGWFENLDGNGTFGKEQKFLTTSRNEFQVGDIDGDGRMDVVAATSSVNLVWLENRLIGDSNNDDAFDSADLVKVFVAGKYEDDIRDNATFDDGDWNQDGDFDTSDLVFAFQAGHYVIAASPLRSQLAAAVEEIFQSEDRRKHQI